jgi:ankyrin repeat protein
MEYKMIKFFKLYFTALAILLPLNLQAMEINTPKSKKNISSEHHRTHRKKDKRTRNTATENSQPASSTSSVHTHLAGCKKHHRHKTRSKKPKNGPLPLAAVLKELPDEIWHQILTELPPEKLTHTALVNKTSFIFYALSLEEPDLTIGTYAVFYAAQKGNAQAVNQFLQYASDFYTCAPFVEAASKGHYEVVKLLIDRKVYIYEKSWDNAFFEACTNNYHNIAELMLEEERCCNSMEAGLEKAAFQGYYNIVKLILDKEPNINRGSAISCAVCHGHYEIAKLILEIKPSELEWAFFQAIKKNYFNIAELILENYPEVEEKATRIYRFPKKWKELYSAYQLNGQSL